MACIGCKNEATVMVYKKTVNFDKWVESKPSYAITDTFRIHGDIVKCLSCGLVYVPRNESLYKMLDSFYSSQPVDNGYIEEEYGRRKAARKILKRLTYYTDDHTKGLLLDVGTGPAFFVSEALHEGWQASGIESGKNWLNFSQEKLNINTIELGGLELLKSKDNNSFQVITAWDFIEHILDPIAFFDLAFSKIAPGGICALSTPKFDSLVHTLLKDRWHAIIPSHITYFSKAVLIEYLKKAGFEIIEIRSYDRFFSLSYLLKRIGWKSEIPFLKKLVVPVNLHDEIEIYCRKPQHNQ